MLGSIQPEVKTRAAVEGSILKAGDQQREPVFERCLRGPRVLANVVSLPVRAGCASFGLCRVSHIIKVGVHLSAAADYCLRNRWCTNRESVDGGGRAQLV